MSNLSIHINFQVLNTKDPKTIIIADQSNWGVAENQPAYLQITIPGSIKPITLNFVKHNIMFINSVSLGLNCVSQDCQGQTYEDLDDGVWEFCLQSNFEGVNKKRFYLKDDQLRQEINKIRIRQGFDYNTDKNVVKDLDKIEFLLLASHALISEGRNNEAMKGFNEASKLVEKYQNCKNCT